MSKSKNKNFLSEIESSFQKNSDSAIQLYRLLREDKIDWRNVMEHVSRRVGKYIDDIQSTSTSSASSCSCSVSLTGKRSLRWISLYTGNWERKKVRA